MLKLENGWPVDWISVSFSGIDLSVFTLRGVRFCIWLFLSTIFLLTYVSHLSETDVDQLYTRYPFCLGKNAASTP